MFTKWEYAHYNDDTFNVIKKYPVLDAANTSMGILNYAPTIPNKEVFCNYNNMRKAYALIFKMTTGKSLHFSINNINRVDHIVGSVRQMKSTAANEANPDYVLPTFNMCTVNVYYVYRDINNVFNYLDTELGRYSTDNPTGDMMGVSIGFKEDRYHRVRIYKTKQSVYVFTNQKISNDFARKLYACVPVFFDHIFNAENDELAINTFKNIVGPVEDWLATIKAWIDVNLDEAKLTMNAIKDTFSEALRSQKQQVINKLNSLRSNIEAHLAQYTRALKEYGTQSALYERINDTEAEDSVLNEFLNFILDKERGSCKLNKVSNKIRLDIVTPLTNYSVAEAERIIKRQINDVTLKQIMLDIFVAQKYTLYMSSSIFWDLMATYRGDISVSSSRYTTSCTKGMPNPHHYYYSCYGDNAPAVVKAMQNGQYIAAYLQLKASVGSFNWTDGPVASAFLSAILDFNEAYAEVPSIMDNDTEQMYTLTELYEEYKRGVES